MIHTHVPNKKINALHGIHHSEPSSLFFHQKKHDTIKSYTLHTIIMILTYTQNKTLPTRQTLKEYRIDV